MITQKELKEIVEYNEDTGIFTWKVDKGRAKKGDDFYFYGVISQKKPEKYP